MQDGIPEPFWQFPHIFYCLQKERKTLEKICRFISYSWADYWFTEQKYDKEFHKPGWYIKIIQKSTSYIRIHLIMRKALEGFEGTIKVGGKTIGNFTAVLNLNILKVCSKIFMNGKGRVRKAFLYCWRSPKNYLILFSVFEIRKCLARFFQVQASRKLLIKFRYDNR